jgi:hypothetical protein
MSGQPNNTPLDASKFRQAYMSNLNLRIALDDKNLQANKTYNRTGQLPVEPSDFRTIEEKLADVLTLRRDVRSQLGTIADGQTANQISNLLTPPELVFYYQQSATINKLMKERYSKGVITDIFISFLQKYMADTLANKGVASGLQQVSGANLLLSGENIARALATLPDYEGLFEVYRDTGIDIRSELQSAVDILPPVDLYQRINAVVDENDRFTLLEEANNFVKDLPSKNEISSKIREVQRLKNVGDNSGLVGETDRIIALIKPNDDTQIQRRNIIDALNRIGRAEPEQEAVVEEEEDDGSSMGLPPPPPVPVAEVDISPPLLKITKKVLSLDDLVANTTKKEKILLFDELNTRIIPNELWGAKKILDVARTSAERNSAGKLNAKLIQLRNTADEQRLMEAIFELDAELKGRMGGNGFLRNKLTMTGRGVVAVATKPRRYDAIKKSDIDTSMGVEKTPRYIPFGRYFINRNRLNDSVVSIKRPSGGSITEFPSQRVSSTLADVLKKIVGKGIPAFEDLEALEENEKAYLHKLAKESHIIDRLSIPAPKKGEVDKDLNRFEILKGQITSGNDNKELIKEFKILIMKLSNMKVIPKSQARDILFDLTSMGF